MWYARYRCEKCGVLGYRALVTADRDTDKDGNQRTMVPYGHPVERILMYACQATGCHRGAVTRTKGAKQLCDEHKRMSDIREQARRDKHLSNLADQRARTQKAREPERQEALEREQRRARLRAKGFKLPGDPPAGTS